MDVPGPVSSVTSPAPGAQVITCDNPSPMTLQGTNTYVLGRNAPDAEVVIVDPGPVDHPAHADAVAHAVGSRRVSAILITHRHRDHTGASAEFAQRFNAPVRGHDAGQCLDSPAGVPGRPLAHGEVIRAGSISVDVLHTPGHTSDSVCFHLPDAGAMLTGDTILGHGTTMLDFPDGTLTDYLATLELLSGYQDTRLLPAHGPAGAQISEVAGTYLRHRQQRLDQAAQILADHGNLTAEELGEKIYGTETPLSPAVITKIAAAQLDHLRRDG